MASAQKQYDIVIVSGGSAGIIDGLTPPVGSQGRPLIPLSVLASVYPTYISAHPAVRVALVGILIMALLGGNYQAIAVS